MYVTLEEAKKYMKVDVNDDDEEIITLLGAAEETIAAFLNAPLSYYASKENSTDLDASTIPDWLKLRIMQFAAESYEHGTVMSEQSLIENRAIIDGLHLFRRCLGV